MQDTYRDVPVALTVNVKVCSRVHWDPKIQCWAQRQQTVEVGTAYAPTQLVCSAALAGAGSGAFKPQVPVFIVLKIPKNPWKSLPSTPQVSHICHDGSSFPLKHSLKGTANNSSEVVLWEILPGKVPELFAKAKPGQVEAGQILPGGWRTASCIRQALA